jgi:hypothetical protein
VMPSPPSTTTGVPSSVPPRLGSSTRMDQTPPSFVTFERLIGSARSSANSSSCHRRRKILGWWHVPVRRPEPRNVSVPGDDRQRNRHQRAPSPFGQTLSDSITQPPSTIPFLPSGTSSMLPRRSTAIRFFQGLVASNLCVPGAAVLGSPRPRLRSIQTRSPIWPAETHRSRSRPRRSAPRPTRRRPTSERQDRRHDGWRNQACPSNA